MNEANALTLSHFQQIMDQFAVINQSIAQCTNAISDLNSRIVSQAEDINKCKDEIKELRNGNSKIKTQMETLQQHMHQYSFENMYLEIKQRFYRQNNVIIKGLPEKNQDDDKITVKKLLADTLPGNNLNVTSVQRLGKFTTGASRILKVRFGCADDALLLLKNRARIPNDTYPTIKIKNDLTPMQQKELTMLYKEMDQRKKNGETNLMITYFNSIPKITKRTEQPPGNNTKRPRDNETPPHRNTKLKPAEMEVPADK